jgi:ABC-type transport system involved in multi-copper enzyme maturation permease subunit
MSVASSIRGKFSRTLTESILDNPVVVRDLRTRMRGMKGFITIGAYILLLGVVEVIALHSTVTTGPSMVNQRVGMSLFETLMWTQTILLGLIVPALTSGSITSELEGKTIEMIALTRLTSGRIVLGKALTGFLYSVVLLLSSVPVAALCLMFGGLSPAEIAASYCVLLAWVFFASCGGVFWSSLVKRTATATLIAYGIEVPYLLFISGLGANAVYGVASSAVDVPWYSSLCPGWIPFMAAARAHICSLRFPIELIPIYLYILSGILLLFVAVTHVKHFRVDRSLQIRSLFTLLCASLMWLVTGDYGSVHSIASGSGGLEIIGFPFAAILVVAAIMVTVFATGPIRTARDSSAIIYAFSLKKIFRADLGGGISFLLLWSAVMYGVFALTIRTYPGGIPRTFWMAYLHMGIALLSCVLGLASIGFLMSAWNRLRRNAILLYVVIGLVIFIFYPCMRVNFAPGMSNPHNGVWNIAAFWPLTALDAVAPGNMVDGPSYRWTPDDAWKAVSFCYLLIATMALLAASDSWRKRPGVQENADAS